MVQKQQTKRRASKGARGMVEVAQRTWHQEPEQRPAGGTVGLLTRWLMAAGGVKKRGRKLPLTSSITLEERKRGSDGAAHQYTSHPRFRPAGLYG